MSTDSELAADAKRFAIEISIGAVHWDDDQSFEIRDLLYEVAERLKPFPVVDGVGPPITFEELWTMYQDQTQHIIDLTSSVAVPDRVTQEAIAAWLSAADDAYALELPEVRKRESVFTYTAAVIMSRVMAHRLSRGESD